MPAIKEWVGMPEFIQEKKEAFRVITFNFDNRKLITRFSSQADVDSFVFYNGLNLPLGYKVFDLGDIDLTKASGIFAQKITSKTKSIWYPYKAHRRVGKQPVWDSNGCNVPKYPIYVISKGRHHNCKTAKVLNDMAVKFTLVVEHQEYDDYRIAFPDNIIIKTPFSNLGLGSIPVRNFVWDYSIAWGHKKHWLLDDNIEGFHRLHENEKYNVTDGAIFKACEDFTDRYSNVKLSGMNYYSFCKATDAVPPFVLNTRIYSCTLIDNSLQHRWRGKYNEDTDLCLRSLKDGDCTILFNAFLCGKITSQRMKGGNTEEVYGDTNKRLEFAESLREQHPDVVETVWKFNRWHHKVDYKGFKDNKLIRADDFKYEGVNNYGLNLGVMI